MNAMDLYRAVSRALAAGDLEQAAELLPKLTVKLKDLAGRGWHGFRHVGDPVVDPLIDAANKFLGSP